MKSQVEPFSAAAVIGKEAQRERCHRSWPRPSSCTRGQQALLQVPCLEGGGFDPLRKCCAVWKGTCQRWGVMGNAEGTKDAGFAPTLKTL